MAKLLTENTGKIFEKAICIAYGIPYDGKFKYSLEEAELLSRRLIRLPEFFPVCTHSAKRGARYDFTTADGLHLSAKTSKHRSGKIAPQVIGQSQPSKFCSILEIPYTTIPDLKKYIQTEFIHVLPVLVEYTFDCPNIYYNQSKNTIQYIRLKQPIPWHNYQYTWTCDWTSWNNSSSLKLKAAEKDISIVEFQFHTKSRTNMAIRWFYDAVLDYFKDYFEITVL